MEIPKFAVIRDQVHNTYKHPILHYVFEDEEFPDVPKDNLIVVDLNESATEVTSIDSYSPHFQVTNCRLEQSAVTDQFEENAGLLNLTIEGVSAPKASEAIESLQPIYSVDNLKETMFNFKTRHVSPFLYNATALTLHNFRNEMVKNVCSMPSDTT